MEETQKKAKIERETKPLSQKSPKSISILSRSFFSNAMVVLAVIGLIEASSVLPPGGGGGLGTGVPELEFAAGVFGLDWARQKEHRKKGSRKVNDRCPISWSTPKRVS